MPTQDDIELSRFAPFQRNDEPLNFSDLIKIFFGFLFLLPFRIYSFFSITISYLIFAQTITFFSNLFHIKPPHHLLKKLGTKLSRLVLFIFGFYKIDIVDKPPYSPRSNVIIVSNHVSYLDVILFMSEEMPSFISKGYVKKLPVIREMAEHLGCLFVETKAENLEKNTSTVTEILSLSNQKQNPSSYRRLVVFPEATTTNGDYLIHFRTGAFVPALPVLPVIIKYKFSRFNPSWETIPLWYHLLRLLTSFVNKAEMHYLPFYFPSQEETENPALFAQNVKKEMTKASGLLSTEHTHEDKSAYHRLIIQGRLDWHPSPKNKKDA